MRATVDQDLCVGCGLCAETCSRVFEMDDGLARVIVDEVPEDTADACQESASSCPVEAIKIEE